MRHRLDHIFFSRDFVASYNLLPAGGCLVGAFRCVGRDAEAKVLGLEREWDDRRLSFILSHQSQPHASFRGVWTVHNLSADSHGSRDCPLSCSRCTAASSIVQGQPNGQLQATDHWRGYSASALSRTWLADECQDLSLKDGRFVEDPDQLMIRPPPQLSTIDCSDTIGMAHICSIRPRRGRVVMTCPHRYLKSRGKDV